MHPSVKKALQVASIIAVALVAVVIVAMISLYRESQQIEERVQSKLDRELVQQPIKIVKYDSITQNRLDTIEARRAMSHRHVDNMYSGELQSVLDSLYNSPDH